MVSRRLLVCFDIQIWAHVNVMNQGRITSRCRVTPTGLPPILPAESIASLRYARGVLVTSSEAAIAIWRTTAVTLFAIYRQSSDVIETDMNIIARFTRKEYIVDFKSRKFR